MPRELRAERMVGYYHRRGLCHKAQSDAFTGLAGGKRAAARAGLTGSGARKRASYILLKVLAWFFDRRAVMPGHVVQLAAVVIATLSHAVPAQAQADACRAADVLGVERVVEIDATGGPRLGNLQYREIDFLEPGEVVLTFDDGPSRQTTERVLEALAAHCTKATFFMVGRMALAEPDMVQRVAALGHTVATHTWSHANLGSLSSDRIEREIEMGISAVSAALGRPVAPFFRFPYLSDPKRGMSYLEGRDLGMFSIDVDSYDFRTRDGDKMRSNVMSQLKKRGKGIILFHDIQHSTARGLKDLLDELKAKGYKVVHLTQKRPATTLAKYDAIAGRELARRMVATADRPLAARSVTWPVTTSPADGKAAAAEELPWSKREATASEPAPPRRSRTPRQARADEAKPERPSWKIEEIPWQEQMLRHLR